MKTRWLLPVLCGLFAQSAIAQTLDIPALTCNVPFQFVVNHTTFPVGEYVVSTNTDGHRLILQNNTEPKYVILVATENIILNQSEIQNQGRMIFALNNGQHVLHQVYLAGDNHTHDIVHGSDVIELAHRW